MDLLNAYSSSDDEDDEPKTKKIRKENILPVPSAIHTMFEGKDVHNREVPKDDPTQHQNRIRCFPHVRGNWATCVFVELKPYLLQDLRTVQEKLHQNLGDPNVKIQPDLHLSVSRVVTFQLHWIELFLRKITSEIKLKVRKFPLYWEPELKVFVNDDKTRTFVGICVRNDAMLKEMVKILDKELVELKLQPFYDPPVFHVSLLWALGNREKELSDQLSVMNQVLKGCVDDGTLEDGGYSQTVDRAICKTGNKTFFIDLG